MAHGLKSDILSSLMPSSVEIGLFCVFEVGIIVTFPTDKVGNPSTLQLYKVEFDYFAFINCFQC